MHQVQAMRNQYMMFFDIILGPKQRPNRIGLDTLMSCKRSFLMLIVISTWFTNIELLSAEIELQKAAVKHAETWHYNFESKDSENNHVLHDSGFLKDMLFQSIKIHGDMKETQL